MKITRWKWGQVWVSGLGTSQVFGDIKITPYSVREWDWRKYGTTHTVGIQRDEVREMIMLVEYLIFGIGMEKKLNISSELKEYLDTIGIKYFVMETREAIKKFNQMMDEGMKVGGLFHMTC